MNWKTLKMLSPVAILVGAFVIAGLMPAGVLADDGLKGWEQGGAYDSHYDVNEFDSFKGTVKDIIDIQPLPGMATGIGLIVEDTDNEKVEVHLGPKSFVDLSAIGLRVGDDVKVKGAWAEINGKFVFMASKVKKGEYVEVKVRLTKDGMPFWAMNEAQLAQERSQE